MNKTKVLTKTELEAKMYNVLMILHTNHPDLKFHVYDERDDKPESNDIMVRSSFWLDGVELADIHRIDGKVVESDVKHGNLAMLNAIVYDLGEAFEEDRKRKIEKK
jgi:hypothetical protein